MTSTVVENATIEAKVVNAENLTVTVMNTDRIPSPELDWYPRAFFRAQFIPDSLLDEWVASGDVRAKKANSSNQSARFFRLSDVREKLESRVDVKVAEAQPNEEGAS